MNLLRYFTCNNATICETMPTCNIFLVTFGGKGGCIPCILEFKVKFPYIILFYHYNNICLSFFY